MNKEILAVVEVVSNEKNVPEEVIFDALEVALATATRKRAEEDIDVRVSIDRETGEYDTFRRWLIHEPCEDDPIIPTRMLLDDDDRAVGLEVGDYIEEPMESIAFGRIAAQTAKQVIVQKVREAERARVVEQYKDSVNTLISGAVKRVDRNGVYLDLGENAEGFIPRDQLVPRESVRTGDRVRGYLYEINTELRGPQLLISRTHPGFLIELFKIEVPEIGQGMIQLHGAARDPGLRAKVAVESLEARLDPVGACIGMRGARVQAVTNELAGERVDIVLWDENAAQFVINAMAPAEVEQIMVDEERNVMEIVVSEEKLAQAIGRGGQNIKLASELTGWELNVMGSEEANAKGEEEGMKIATSFMEELDIDEEMAILLVQEGFTNLEEIAYVPISEMLDIEGFDLELAEELQSRARDRLLTQALVQEERLNESPPAEDLLALDGVDQELGEVLAANGIVTRDDLAEQSVDELMELGFESEEDAAELIMTARAHWFED